MRWREAQHGGVVEATSVAPARYATPNQRMNMQAANTSIVDSAQRFLRHSSTLVDCASGSSHAARLKAAKTCLGHLPSTSLTVLWSKNHTPAGSIKRFSLLTPGVQNEESTGESNLHAIIATGRSCDAAYVREEITKGSSMSLRN